MSLYPDLHALYEERRALEKRIYEAMKAQFLGRRVRVNHYHGSYTGIVRQVGHGEFSVMVVNDASRKSSQRWVLSTSGGRPEIELLADSPEERAGGDE